MVFDVLIFANFVVIMLSVIASVVGNGKQKGSKNAKSIKTMFKNVFKVTLLQSYFFRFLM